MVIMINLILVLLLGLITYVIWDSSRYAVEGARLPKGASELKKIQMHAFLAGMLPSRKLLERIGLDVKIKNKLDAAHVRLTAAEFFNLKIFVALFFAGLPWIIMGKFSLIWCVCGLLAGYIFFDFWLARQISQRKYNIVRVLPETVDLLGLCVEAGLDFTTAIRWVIDKVPANPLIEELVFVAEEIKWGKSRTQALKDMSKRLNIPEISSFVQTLVQAERMGTPVSEAFAILSEDTRLQRFNRGERYAMQAPIKILLPLVFCILPVIGIVVAGPILLQFMTMKLF